jgi:hypothetical protein
MNAKADSEEGEEYGVCGKGRLILIEASSDITGAECTVLIGTVSDVAGSVM